MPRLFFEGEWFDELSPNSMAESEFESLLIARPELLKPDHLIVPYRRTVYAPDGSSARADLAFIDRRYREWTVIEVEMNRHSLFGHVIPQVRTLKDASYGEADAAYLHGKRSHLDVDRLSDLIRLSQPKVVVIANKPDNEWETELRRLGISQVIVEIFRSDHNRHVFRVDGTLSALPTNVLCHLTVDLMLSRLAVVSAPAALSVVNGGEVYLNWRGQITRWRRMDIQNICYLQALGIMPLQKGRIYEVTDDGGPHFTIQEGARV